MNPTTEPVPAPSARFTAAGVLLLAAALAAAWGNSFTGPFVFDDIPSLHDNPSIRSLSTALVPPAGGLTVSGRPLLNLSFAVNYALSDEHTAGYHALNLCIHLLATLTLFGLVRRTLRLPVLAARYGAGADRLALAVALLWAVHPLQTESVTYLVQRAESLTGMWILLTLYCFVRSTAAGVSRRWLATAAGTALLGVLTKETAVVAPVLVLLHDRTFVSGSFRAAWSRHCVFYLALAGSWLVLAAQLLSTGDRGGTTGFATPVTAVQYALLQLPAVAHYLWLAVWPAKLVFDYGPFQSVPPAAVAAGALLVVPLLSLTFWALVRRPALGFVGAWFFLLLAPSSSVLPVASQVMAEHRMYLALAAVATLVVLGLWRGPGRYFPWAMTALAALCLARTVQRNADYESGLQLWKATARDCPDNPRGLLNFGQALAAEGRWPEAAAQFETALHLQPAYISAHYNLGLVDLQLRQFGAAGAHFETALRGNPDLVEAAYNWGNALAAAGRPADAAGRYEYVLRLDPGHARARYNLGNALVELGRPAEAVPHYRASVRLAPAQADAHFNLANALFQTGRPAEAVPEYEAVLRLTPQDAEAARNLALARQAAAESTPH
jgi:tetratricopeptide (TPR) repeat protein